MRVKLPNKIADKMADKMDKLSSKANVLKQAGGGVSKYTDPASFQIESFEPPVLAGLKEAYNHVQTKDRTWEQYLTHMASEHSNAMGSASEQDLAHPLSNYFISTSHNTYLTGHQLYGKANVDGYRNVLLRGCRSVEIDVWDGESPSSDELSSDDEKLPPAPAPATPTRPAKWRANSNRVEPVVLHGYTATKDVSFRKVCEAIRENAFVTSKLPVIVSLEVHCTADQQELMVEIIEETFSGFLIDAEKADDKVLPSPKDLQEKILIKVKYSPPTPEGTTSPERLSKATSKSSAPSDDDDQKKAKSTKIIESLSRLGIFTRSYHYKALDQPEASVPTHVFSLSESTLSEVHKTDPVGLFDHNKNYLMRAYPKGTRVSSSNLNPAPYWRQGVQMVALNWQRIDAGVMLNEAMFVNTGGWVLKPAGYRSHAKYADTCGGHGSNLTVQFIAGQNLEAPTDIDPKDLKTYIKCELHLEVPNEWENMTTSKEKAGEFKDKTKTTKSIHPNYNSQTIEYRKLPSIVPELGFIRFKVMQDKSLGVDQLIGWACIRLDRLQRGYRFIHLFSAKGVQTQSVLLVNLDFDFQLREQANAAQPTLKQPPSSGQTTLPLR